jgi:hypothetical protein
MCALYVNKTIMSEQLNPMNKCFTALSESCSVFTPIAYKERGYVMRMQTTPMPIAKHVDTVKMSGETDGTKGEPLITTESAPPRGHHVRNQPGKHVSTPLE